jgi:hypothetical protein
MIEPVAFGPNPDAARTNTFVRGPGSLGPAEIQARALVEFHRLADRLRDEGVEVLLRRDAEERPSPDSIFPNNWVSFHGDGRVVLYPMEPFNRRRERRTDIIDWLRGEGFTVSEVVDLSGHEIEGRFLEGTGSMVFDRLHGAVYACLSPRTTPSLLREYGERFGLDVVSFRACDRTGAEVYHTNVLLALGKSVAVVCREAIVGAGERRAVLDAIAATGREILDITYDQLYAFLGNVLELEDARGEPLLALSQRAFDSLGPDGRGRLERHARLVPCPIPTIEDCGGGSVRCMLAEVFLPRGG